MSRLSGQQGTPSPTVGVFLHQASQFVLPLRYPVESHLLTLPNLKPVCFLLLCSFLLECVFLFSVGISLCFWCFVVLELLNMGNTPSVPKESLLGGYLNKWAKYSCEPLTKKEMIFYYDNVWLQHILGSEKRWYPKGSPSYYTVLQLELFCARARGKGEIPYAQHLYYYIKRKRSQMTASLQCSSLKGTQEKICCMKGSGRKMRMRACYVTP